MKKIALGLMAAGLTALGIGFTAQAAGSGAPTVTPSSGGPGFTFTVTVEGCSVEDDITFSFPPNPPQQVVACSSSAPPAPTTAVPTTAATTTTIEETTTTEEETTTTTIDCPDDQLIEGEQPPFDPCNPCPPPLLVNGPGLPEECNPPSQQGVRTVIVPSQATGTGTASATFTAPTAPGTYSGTVSSAAGSQPFSISVVTLPATGATDESSTIFAIAVLLLIGGAAMIIISQARRPEHDTM